MKQCSVNWTNWRCSVRNKKITRPAIVRQKGTEFAPGLRDHIHDPIIGSDIAATIISRSKRRGNAEQFVSAGMVDA